MHPIRERLVASKTQLTYQVHALPVAVELGCGAVALGLTCPLTAAFAVRCPSSVCHHPGTATDGPALLNPFRRISLPR